MRTDGRPRTDLERQFGGIYVNGSWLVDALPRETRSGAGSFLSTTRELRSWLPRLLSAFEVRRMADIPCGEWGFMAEVPLGDVEYFGCDIVREIVEQNTRSHPGHRFLHFDATREVPPPVDLIFAKDLFQHLPNALVADVLGNFKASGAKLLVTSCDTFPPPESNDARPPEGPFFAPENLAAEPFRLGPRVATVRLDRKFYSVWLLDSSSSVDRCRELLVETLGSVEADLGAAPPGAVALDLELYAEGPQGALVLPRSGGFLAPGSGFALDPRQLRLLERIDGAAGIGELASRIAQGLRERDPALVTSFPDLIFDLGGLEALVAELVRAGFLRRVQGGLETGDDVRLIPPARLCRAGGRTGVDLRGCEALALQLLLEGLDLGAAHDQAARQHLETVSRDVTLFFRLASILGLVRIPRPVTGRAASRFLDALGKELALRSDAADPFGLRSLYFEATREDGWCAMARRARDHTLASWVVSRILLSAPPGWRPEVDLSLRDLLDEQEGGA
ncbi:MAG: hypothetical protein HYY06_18290 [Deltaproteobacteria bacterium]|nr:hypothetical protein [Deltaproteobacteria bacterium]